jgi:hypothetical protein
MKVGKPTSSSFSQFRFLVPRVLRPLVPSMASIRLSVFLTFVAVVLTFLSARVLYADVKEIALSAGHELLGLHDLTHDAEAVSFNGAPFHHASLVVKSGVREVLDRIEEHCEKAPNIIGRGFLEIPEKELEKKLGEKPTRAFRHGVFREEAKDESHGMVVCFVDEEDYGVSEIPKRLERFRATRDLTVFGKLRYTYAEKLKSGATEVVTMWADRGLDIRSMFPSAGDAAGTDSDVLPRPPAARRILSANAEGLPYAVRLYDSGENADKVRAFYDSWMEAHGFDKVKAGDQAGASYVRADGYQAFLAVGSRKGKTTIAVSEAGRADGTSTAVVQVAE